jgi:hypothetical protein
MLQDELSVLRENSHDRTTAKSEHCKISAIDADSSLAARSSGPGVNRVGLVHDRPTGRRRDDFGYVVSQPQAVWRSGLAFGFSAPHLALAL